MDPDRNFPYGQPHAALFFRILIALSLMALLLTGCKKKKDDGALLLLGAGALSGGNGNPSWVQDAYLKASNTQANDSFAESVSISGDTIVVGAPGEDSNQTSITNADGSASSNNGATSAGAVYVYKKDTSGNWIQDAYLKASNAQVSDIFGITVSISGDTIAVGAYLEDSAITTILNSDGSAASDNIAPDSGAVYVFKKDGNGSVTGTPGNWYQDAYLKPANTWDYDGFGSSVSVSGDTIVVGAKAEDCNDTTITNADGQGGFNDLRTDSGAVYVFKRDAGGDWFQDAYLKASNAGINDFFGSAVAISNDTIAVGTSAEDSGATGITNADGAHDDTGAATNSGAVYVFKKDGGGNWIQDAYLKASNARGNDQFGMSVSVSGDTIVVGANVEDSGQTTITNTDGAASSDTGATNSGAVYVFKKDGGGNWIQDAYLKASNADAADQFGAAVAISGELIVVGANFEDSSQTTITNADGADHDPSEGGGATDSGAVYVFKKDPDGNWIQDAYLKASNAQANDRFGNSVSISGNTIVAGAFHESGGQTSIINDDGSAASDNNALNSGAVYVFKR